MKTEAHKKQILSHMKQGYKVTRLEAIALFNCFSLSSRISEIKAEGYDVKKKRFRSGNKNFVEYSLIILLMFISSFTFSQELDSHIGKEINGISITKELIVDFEEYCYNDSTQEEYDWYLWYGDTISQNVSLNPGHHHGYLGKWKIWVHRQANFSNLVTYVNREYKK